MFIAKGADKRYTGIYWKKMRVVIAGAGFAGLTLAQQLPSQVRATVLDPQPRFGFLPNIHELVSGVKRPRNLEIDRAAVIRRVGQRYLPEAVTELDRHRRLVRTSGDRTLPYDHLVLAVGGQDRFHGVPGAAEYALPFKTVAQCATIGDRLQALLYPPPGSSTAAATPPRQMVIVGGGLEGVECLGEILRRYLRSRNLHVHLVDSQERLLTGTPKALGAHLASLCARLPVTLHLGVRVRRVTPTEVVLSDGASLLSDATIWTGGLAPSALIHRAGLSPSANAWAEADTTLRSRLDPRIWVAGDVAAPPMPLSKQAYFAQQMGSHLAANLARVARGRRPRTLRPSPKPMLIAFGDRDTFLVLERLALAGPSLAALKEGVFQLGMAQLQSADGGRGLAAIGRRISHAAQTLLLPQLGSLNALRRLPDVKVLRD